MKSHQYASELLKVAQFLVERPEVDLGHEEVRFTFGFYSKESFVDVVRAFGAGKKEVGSYELTYIPTRAPQVRVTVPRDKVCTKVQSEKWECEPLMTPEEFTRE